MKKTILFPYILFLVFCVAGTIYSAGKKSDTYTTQRFGTFRDDAVELGDDTEISVDFVADSDDLSGINVQFQAESRFQDEVMKAALYNAETMELLSECEVPLRYERVQNKDGGSSVFFPLSAQDVRDRKLRVALTLGGEAVYVHPSLVVSDSRITKSELRVDGKKSVANLVFTVRYFAGQTDNTVNAILNGLLWILAGSLVFYWAHKRLRMEQSHIVGASAQKREMPAEKGRISLPKVAGGLVLFAVLCFVMLYIYQFAVEKAMDADVSKSIGELNELGERTDLNAESGSLEFLFTCKKKNFSGIRTVVSGELRDEDAKVRVVVKDETNGQELADKKFRLEKYLKKKESKLSVSFAQTLEKSKDHQIRVQIIPENFEDTEIAVEKISAQFGSVNFLKKAYAVLCALLLMTAALIYAACFIGAWKPEKIFVALALPLGIIVSLVIAIDTVPDEPSHIDTAYRISNEIMGIAESEKPGYIYKRADDADPAAEEKQSLNAYSYERLCRQLFTRCQDETLVECSARNNLGNAGRLYYLPQALGITAGRLLGLGFMPVMMLGRLFSLLCYIFLTYFAIKKLPIGKVSLLLLAVLPIALQQAASFSYDGMINAVAFVFVSYGFSLIYSERAIRLCDMLVCLLAGIMLATVKGGVYIPLCLLPLLAVFVRKDVPRWQKRVICIMSVIFLYAFSVSRLSWIFTRFSAAPGTVTGGAASTGVYTFRDLVSHPLHTLGVYVNTVYEQGDAHLRNLLGGNLAWREVNISWMIMFGFLLLILLSCIVYGQEKGITPRQKGYMGALSLASFLCVETSMLLVWTPVTYTYITGVQGRYFMPFLPLLLLIGRNTFLSVRRDIGKILIFAVGMLDIITILQVVQRVL